MPIKIISKSEPTNVNHIVTSILGDPGIGKTTLGLTANKPLLLDFDDGIHRAATKGDHVKINEWGDIMGLTKDDLKPFKTIVVDTAGRMIDCLSRYAKELDGKNQTRAGGLSQQGWGVVKAMAYDWLSDMKSYGLDVVLICHAMEKQVGEETKIRVDVGGSTKEEIYKMSDVMGWYHVVNGKRRFDIKPTEHSFGKSPEAVPSRNIGSPVEEPDALAKLIAESKAAMNNKADAGGETQNAADALREEVEKDGSLDWFNKKLGEMQDASKPMKRLLIKLAAEKKLLFDADDKKFYKDE